MEGLQDIWGWQPALYLFLGGMGAGAFIAAMVVYFREGDKARSTVFASLVAAVVCLAVGLLLLLSELITPLRGMMMWQSFSNFGSWMTFGAWIVFAALVVFALEAIVVWEKTAGALAKRIKGFDGYAPKLARALGVVSCVLGFCVAVYTGILLMSAPGVPLWNTLLLPCLFTVSALDTGVALVEVIALANRKKAALSKETNRILEYAVVALVVLELAVLALLLVSMAGSPGSGVPRGRRCRPIGRTHHRRRSGSAVLGAGRPGWTGLPPCGGACRPGGQVRQGPGRHALGCFGRHDRRLRSALHHRYGRPSCRPGN